MDAAAGAVTGTGVGGANNGFEAFGKIFQGGLNLPQIWEMVATHVGPHIGHTDLLKIVKEPLEIFDGMFNQLELGKLKNPLMSFCLYRAHVMQQRNKLNPEKGKEPQRPGSDIDDHFFAQAAHFLRTSDLVYQQDPEAAGIAKRDLLQLCLADNAPGFDPQLPRHAIFFDHLTKSVVVAVRGTASLRDCITDLIAVPAPALGNRGTSHKGIAEAAEDMLHITVPVLASALKKHPSYTITVTGHSLGAGTAIMIALTLRHMEDTWAPALPKNAIKNMRVYAYAPPPVWAPLDALSKEDMANIYVFINNIDLVPRSTLRNLEIFFHRLMKIDGVTIDKDFGKLMFAVLNPNGEEGSNVAGLVTDALKEADKELLDQSREWIHPQLYHPGRIFHIYPAENNEDEESSELDPFQTGRALSVAKECEVQELGAEHVSHVLPVEGDALIHDHDCEPYIKALMRLTLAEPAEAK